MVMKSLSALSPMLLAAHSQIVSWSSVGWERKRGKVCLVANLG